MLTHQAGRSGTDNLSLRSRLRPSVHVVFDWQRVTPLWSTSLYLYVFVSFYIKKTRVAHIRFREPAMLATATSITETHNCQG